MTTTEHIEADVRGDRQFLEMLARNLDGMKREGAAMDQPEGTRYVKFSDTLVRQMAEAFRGIARRLDVSAPNDWD